MVMSLMPSIRVRSAPGTRANSVPRRSLGDFSAAAWRELSLAAFLRLLLRFFDHLRQRGTSRGTGRVGLHISLQLLLALFDPLYLEIVGGQHLLQFEQHVFPPISLQAMGDLFLTGLDPSIS